MGVTVPVLTYHSMRAGHDAYAENDHTALTEDLELIHRLGLRILPLETLVEHLLLGRLHECTGSVCLSFDDGPDLDWRDIPHPQFGLQKGMARILREFASRTKRADVHATAFVIAGPEARRTLDRTCMLGLGWWEDNWWPQARQQGMSIGNHSWDHNHATLTHFTPGCGEPGSFNGIDSYSACDLQIRQAADYIDTRLGHRQCRLLAYPFGEYSEYLIHEYLPHHQHEHRQIAGFTTAGEPVHAHANRWCLPRFVCGDHWRSPEELASILLGRA
ncbi:hypothetical protein CKO35_03960 [Ectothiorhodospira shaposhnikovii]|uniref:polysaccharide deacetylase family protein n=1 Tax=Ectothiorhodospira shaposhnikovii TaxID=1054 RepID=UPI001904F29C|nr:polysaccharide deacetylase family protein [Ectothiorhodospira shaposhnikovii]MBK1672463.1 hypothetical protein [Ectothiorhodospira shaposhnikovii]